MSDQSTLAVSLRPGDQLLWSGRWCEVLEVLSGKYRFRGGRPISRQVIVSLREPDGTEHRRLYYRSDETVQVIPKTVETPAACRSRGRTGSSPQSIPDRSGEVK